MAKIHLNASGRGPRFEARPPEEQQAFLHARGLDLEEDALEPQEPDEVELPPTWGGGEPHEEPARRESREFEQEQPLDWIYPQTEDELEDEEEMSAMRDSSEDEEESHMPATRTRTRGVKRQPAADVDELHQE